jgi:hypothetical protein
VHRESRNSTVLRTEQFAGLGIEDRRYLFMTPLFSESGCVRQFNSSSRSLCGAIKAQRNDLPVALIPKFGLDFC